MRYRKTKNYKEKLDEYKYDYYICLEENSRLDLEVIFSNKNSCMIEIGCGKAGFIVELAKRNPGINYIGIEKNEALLLDALEKVSTNNLSNIKFLSIDATRINEIFKINSFDRIYLNFSDPWPKKRHEKRRLTSKCFLDKYDCILSSEKEIYFKTDNKRLFEFTLTQLSQRKDLLVCVDIDIHTKGYDNDDERLVLTEYEKRFMQQNLPIYRIEVKLLGNK